MLFVQSTCPLEKILGKMFFFGKVFFGKFWLKLHLIHSMHLLEENFIFSKKKNFFHFRKWRKTSTGCEWNFRGNVKFAGRRHWERFGEVVVFAFYVSMKNLLAKTFFFRKKTNTFFSFSDVEKTLGFRRKNFSRVVKRALHLKVRTFSGQCCFLWKNKVFFRLFLTFWGNF